MTEAGLNTVNLSQLNTWQQTILFILIIIGSAIFVSSGVIHVRKRAFEQKLQDLADRRQKRLLRPMSLTFTSTKPRLDRADDTRAEAIASGAVRGSAIRDWDEGRSSIPQTDRPQLAHRAYSDKDSDTNEAGVPSSKRRIQFADNVRQPAVDVRDTASRPRRDSLSRVFSNTGVGAHSAYFHPRNAAHVHAAKRIHSSPDQADFNSKRHKYLDTVNGYIGRNSQFHHLTDEERRKLGGIEYDALCLLSWVVPIYFVLFQLVGALGCGTWMAINIPDVARENGLNPFWVGAFFAVSAFNNSGMALLDANATALQTSYYMLLTLSLLILAGNTCFPPFLRLILWTMKKCIRHNAQSEKWQKRRQVLAFILDHPRRVYTNLFPAAPTWWLVSSLVLLNGIDWVAFEILNLGNPVVESIPPKFRVLDGLFQAFAVRAGGFYVVAISGLYPGTLVLYVLMMYLSAFPVTMTIRNTNVYEERSLAIFADDPVEPAEKDQRHSSNGMTPLGLVRSFTTGNDQNAPRRTNTATSTWSRPDFIRQQLRSQLGHDLWLVSLAVLFITIIETSSFKSNPVVFSTFNILFEIVSAYGTVGISVGVPWNAYSFCGAWHTGSKLILCAVMLRGRHRGLPVAIDRAILLPDESLAWAEEEDAVRREWKAKGVAMRQGIPLENMEQANGAPGLRRRRTETDGDIEVRKDDGGGDDDVRWQNSTADDEKRGDDRV
ncbi:hypothetical protein OHC33_004168 [Knufia fluminis]|uniref:Potassium transport protein n=1 Tax=Knufia fluminis TaxID=191047 RepID=A0AAN8FAA8_9EURO|nr:hypothetical protein OHC33_004168 [Knufia fluminis]